MSIVKDDITFYGGSIFIPHDKVDLWVRTTSHHIHDDIGMLGNCNGETGDKESFFIIRYYVKGALLVAYYFLSSQLVERYNTSTEAMKKIRSTIDLVLEE